MKQVNRKNSRTKSAELSFAQSLSTEQLRGLAGELQKLRSYPPITKRADGKYEGDILGFVKGLRLSARIAYFLREALSHTRFEVSWGHLLDENEDSCSQECDIIIHNKGHFRKWNGGEAPIMEFKFILASQAHVVVSCKSILTSIDADHPKNLAKFGVEKVILFAECCAEKNFAKLRARAVKAGYTDLFVLYFADKNHSVMSIDDSMHFAFSKRVIELVPK